MKMKCKFLFLFLIFFSCFISLFHQNVYSVTSIGDSAESVILMEMKSGRILYGKEIDKVHLTASIAKIMTAIVAIENGNLNQYCTVDYKTTQQVGSSIYLKENDQIKLIDLIYGMMLRSGNDAAYLIANSVFSSEQKFIYQMNELAKKLKMTSSTFANPSGLDDETKNYSTAKDMAILMSYAMQNEIFRKVVKCKNYSCKTKNNETYYFNNKHKLIHQNEYATGGKTGYTKLAKRTLVTSYQKNHLEIVVVTFNCGNDWEVHNQLAEYAFQNYENTFLWKAGILDVCNSLYPATPIIYEDVTYPIREDEELKCTIFLLKSPRENENIIGKIKLYLNNQVVKEISIYRYY